jgi:hypothetical protein
MEWSNKKQCWGEITHTIEIIKSLANKYQKQYGWGWCDILLEENGMTYDDIVDPCVENTRYKLIDGLTKQYKNFHKTSIIFGVMEQYRDPSF